jgi:hypothetical protein
VKVISAGLEIECQIENLGSNPELEVYWGTKDGFTFADRWDQSKRILNVKEGKNVVAVKNAKFPQHGALRLFLKNDDGQFWSVNSTHVTKK